MGTNSTKIKEFLELLKDRVFDPRAEEKQPQHEDKDGIWLLPSCLLHVELLLRKGYSFTATSSSQEPLLLNDSLLHEISKVAGKPVVEVELLEPSTQTLMMWWSNLAAAGGKLCELLYQQTQKPFPSSSSLVFQNTLRRCREVQDERFEVLLNLLFLSSKNTDSIEDRKKDLLYVGEGYLYQAAMFQPKLPIFYKKAWNLLLLNNATTEKHRVPSSSYCEWQMSFAIQQLRQCVQGQKGPKKNPTKLTELAQQLCEALLSHFDTLDNTTTTQAMRVFVQPFRSISPLPTQETLDLIASILVESLSTQNSSSSTATPQLQIRWHLLKARFTLVQENYEIHCLASPNKEKHHHHLDTTNLRRERLASVHDETRIFPEEVKELQKWVLSRRRTMMMDSKSEIPNEEEFVLLERSVCKTLTEYLERSQERSFSQYLSNNHRHQAYQHILDFASTPFLPGSDNNTNNWTTIFMQDDNNSKNIDSHDADHFANLLEIHATVWASTVWMFFVDMAEDGDIMVVAVIIDQILSFLKHRIEYRKKKLENQDSVVRSSIDSDEMEVIELQGAYDSLHAFALLLQSPFREGKAGSNERQVVQNFLRSNRIHGEELDAKYGGVYFAALLAWSGLFRSASWQAVTRADAQSLVLQCRKSLQLAQSKFARVGSPVDRFLVELAAIGLVGSHDEETHGFQNKIHEVLALVDGLEDNIRAVDACLLRVSCICGVVRSYSTGRNISEKNVSHDRPSLSEDLKRVCYESLDKMKEIPNDDGRFLFWGDGAFKRARDSLTVGTRLLLAHILFKEQNMSEASRLLELAVEDAPGNGEALFMLGAFQLQLGYEDSNPSLQDRAKVLLTKAAKANTNNADPFALLGHYYETKGDVQRATGCYRKALQLDEGNPIAGRGLIRLLNKEEVQILVKNAIEADSPFGGWAWNFIANEKKEDSHDEFACIAYLKAIRSSDIESGSYFWLSTFLRRPSDSSLVDENIEILCSLASCYRRLGRYTAALRTYNSSIEIAPPQMRPKILASCAQVETELGLLDCAIGKYRLALQGTEGGGGLESPMKFGFAYTLLLCAHRNMMHGKFGSAIRVLEEATALFGEGSLLSHHCVCKLLGDIYTAGASIPLELFNPPTTDARLSFLEKGSKYYEMAAEVARSSTFPDSLSIVAAAKTDAAINFLVRAQLSMSSAGHDEAEDLFARASVMFREALELQPSYSVAWSGLGCSYLHKDPLLAQHCFIQCIELERMSPDALVALAVLCIVYKKTAVAESVVDLLTQVAEGSPMIWICRGLLHECRGDSEKAADAYATSLQFGRTDTALLRLAVCRRLSEGSVTVPVTLSMEEYHMRESIASSHPVQILYEMLCLEDGWEEEKNDHTSWVIRARQWVDAVLSSPNEWTRLLLTRHPEIKGMGAVELSSSSSSKITSHDQDLLSCLPMDDAGCSSLEKLMFHPQSASLWLDAAKEFLAVTALPQAHTCLKKAERMYRKDLLSNELLSVGSTSCEEYSDTLALLYGLNEISSSTNTTILAMKNHNENDHSHSPFLQESIWMNPSNRYARSMIASSL